MSFKEEFKNDIQGLAEYYLGDAAKEHVFEGKYGPIIGINGIGNAWVKRGGMREFMKSENVGGVLTFFGGMEKGIAFYVPLLAGLISKYPDSVIVAESAGGLVLFKYLQEYGTGKIKSAITLGTPVLGIPKFLRILGNRTIEEAQPDSETLKGLVDFHPPKGLITSYFAEEDKFIPHPERIKLNWPKVIVPAKSHADLQNHYKWIESKLKTELGISS